MDAYSDVGSLSAAVLLLALLVYFLAGAVKGTLGLGLPTTAVSLMAQVIDVRHAIALVVVPMIIANVWQVYRAGDFLAVFRRYAPLATSMAVFIGVFSLAAGQVSTRLLTLVLGIVVALFASINLLGDLPRLSSRHDRSAQLFTGMVAGFMGGLSALWAPPIVIYLTSRRINKEEFVQSIGLFLLIGSVVLLIGYAYSGMLTPTVAGTSLLLVVPALLGFALGERVRARLSGERFRRVVLWFFLLMGLNLVRRAILT